MVLWGVSAARRKPGEVHPWHSDIESCSPDGGFVSVWVGIENTSRDSSLQMLAGSHLLGRSVQEARAAVGLPRDEASPEALLELARERAPDVELVVPDMRDGEAIVADGRLWHGTENRNRSGERLALLFQFAAADRAVRIPDLSSFEWPFRVLEEPRPPVILVRGSDHGGPNRVVPPPPLSGMQRVETVVHAFDLPLDDEQSTEPWRPFSAFRGSTGICADISCHASVLAAGHTPHAPHAHAEEEILIPLHGEVELVIPPRTEHLRPGAFVYYPAGQYHTIRNPGMAPVGYLMFKWRAPATGEPNPLGVQILRFGEMSPPEDAPPFWAEGIFEGPTGCLGKLHAHLTVLQPGAGYEPHHDAHDVAIVTLAGTVETLGREVRPRSVVYAAGGELHGMRNVGSEPARYLVFELHAPGMEPLAAPPPLHRRAASRLARGGKRIARPLWRRIRRLVP